MSITVRWLRCLTSTARSCKPSDAFDYTPGLDSWTMMTQHTSMCTSEAAIYRVLTMPPSSPTRLRGLPVTTNADHSSFCTMSEIPGIAIYSKTGAVPQLCERHQGGVPVSAHRLLDC